MKHSFLITAIITSVSILFPASVLHARAKPQDTTPKAEPPIHKITTAASPIKIDGLLDDTAWQSATTIDVNIEINPGENIPAPVKTVCYVTYDTNYFYVGFRAFDPDPKAIRAHLTDRDQSWRDDFVGFMVDTFNDQRRGFEFFVNPLGVQMDLSRNEVSGGNQEDATWDTLWDSAGRITAEGYEVEMKIPFSSLRFARTEGDLTWTFSPFRAYPRNVRHQIFPVPLARDNNCMFCQMPKITGLAGIKAGKDLEFDPTVTSQRVDEPSNIDDPASPFTNGRFHTKAGISARWGVTPNISLNAAANPDFSQVEADAAQLAENIRFALFYPEKRPFFQEGADFFSTPLQAVYTRTMADPQWGIKATGKEGKQAFGVFVVRDRVRNLLFPANQKSGSDSYDTTDTAGVFRYRRDVGKSSTIGMLATSRQGDGYRNRVVGVDGLLRFSPTDSLQFQLLHSTTRYTDQVAQDNDQPRGDFSGNAVHLFYLHEARNWQWWGLFSDLGKDLRADLGFIPRVDTRDWVAGGQHVWIGDKQNWYSQITLGTEGGQTHNHDGSLTDQFAAAYLNFQGPLQSNGQLRVANFKELYDGVLYQGNRAFISAQARPSGNIDTSIFVRLGDTVDYANSRPARIVHFEPNLTYNLGKHLTLGFSYLFERLNVDQGRLYDANLGQVRAVYQFTSRAFLRAIVHYLNLCREPTHYVDEVKSKQRTFFTQILFSYKINPQTMLFVGYSDNRAAEGRLDMTQTNRTFFAKVGYALLM